MSSKNRTPVNPKDESYVSDNYGTDEDLWTSPVKAVDNPEFTRGQKSRSDGIRPALNGKSTYEDQQTREAILRQEFESVRRVNEAIEGVVESLGKAQSNMRVVNQTVSSASSLLNTWTRILSQTEHNQRLILDPFWQGASQDIANVENEVLAKQQAAERKEFEEQERKTAAARKDEDDERRRSEAAAQASKPALSSSSRGRGRSAARGSGTAQQGVTGYVATGNTSTKSTARGSNTRRTTSGIGRGVSRGGRGRGL